MADTWTIVAAASGVLGNITAIAVSMASIRRADAALVQAQELADDYTGAATNIMWREQIIALHDRGLGPEQIRRIMHLETGGDTWEDSVGRIDDILRDIPRHPPT
jgi:hypothetical protein